MSLKNLTASFQTAVNAQPLPSQLSLVGKIGRPGDSVTLNPQPLPPKPLPPMEVFANVKAALSTTQPGIGGSARLDAPVVDSKLFVPVPVLYHTLLEKSDPTATQGGGFGYTGPSGPPTSGDSRPPNNAEPGPKKPPKAPPKTPPPPPKPKLPVLFKGFFDTTGLIGPTGSGKLVNIR